MSLSEMVYAKSIKTSKIGEKRRPDQKLPNKVWDKVEKDISIEFFEGQDLSSRRRQLRTNLTNFLKDVSTGTANGENGLQPELQHVDIIPLLKSSDVYASYKMAEKRIQTIQEIQTPKKRKVQNTEEAQSDEIAEIDLTRKASRSRCTAAIEKISEEVAASNSMQEKFFLQQAQRHAYKQSRNASITAIDEQEVLRCSKLAIKADQDMLVFKKEHSLISKDEYRAQANRLLCK